MSLQALVWALRVPRTGDVDDSALRTLAILADYASEQYVAFPSNTQLMADRGISRATLYRHLKALHEAGLIVPGDSSVVAYLPANRRPKVWLVNAWDRAGQPVDNSPARGLIRETPGPARGLIGPPSGVSSDEIHKEEQEPTSESKWGTSPGRTSAAVEFPDRDCIHGERALMWVNPKNGRRGPRCPLCRRQHGRIVLERETTDA